MAKKLSLTPEKAMRQLIRARAASRAQYKAHSRLQRQHKAEFDQYYREELKVALKDYMEEAGVKIDFDELADN
jgi:hypothetical protein